MRVLVTGGAGTLGALVCTRLLEGGHSVRALEHSQPVLAADDRVRGDLLDRASLDEAVDGVQAVVHLAAVTHSRDPRRYRRVNVDGTEALVAAAARVDRFVYVSSTAIDPDGGPYSRSKLDAESVVRAAMPQAAIVRLPDVAGAGGEGIDRVIEASRAGRWVPVVGRGRDVHRLVTADDAAAAIVGALDRPGRTLTLGGPPVTTAELVRRHGGRPLYVPTPLVRLGCRVARVVPLPVYPDQLDRLRSHKAPPGEQANGA